jgi:non-canonical purine NTP pyrophosphatase (RdgB/HAM1 family)
VTAGLLGRLVFVTSNTGKAREASALLGRPVEARLLDQREIQSLDFEEVVRAKAVEAARLLGTTVLVEDSGLAVAAWSGFPGPLTRWVTASVGQTGLARMLDPFSDRRVDAVSALGLAEPGSGEADVLVAVGRVSGHLALLPRGESGFGWDVLFVPDGDERTFAEMPLDEKNRRSHRASAFAALRRLLG